MVDWRKVGGFILLIVFAAACIWLLWPSKKAPKNSETASKNSPTSQSVPAAPVAKDTEKENAKKEEQPAEATPASHRWGNALNSAAEDGAGAFEKKPAQDFLKSIDPKLAAYVVQLRARLFLPLPLEADEAAAKELFPGEDLAELQKSAAPRTVYMQFLKNPDDAQRAEVARAGVELLGYRSAYTWTARGNVTALLAAARLPFVRTLARIDARDKMQLAVFLGRTPEYALTADGLTRFSVLGAPGTSVQAIQAEVNSAPALAGLQLQAGNPSILGPRFEVVARANQALALAALDGSAYIEHIPPPVAPRDATTDKTSNIDQVRDAAPNLSGNGVTVAVRELGRPEQHVDFVMRTTYVDNDGDTSNPGTFQHATSVVGQIASSGVAQPFAKGVAPAAKILVYSLKDSSFGTADINEAAGRGSRISNHSYGPTNITTFGDYNTVSADWDGAIRTNNLLAFFAGNEEPDALRYNHIDFFVGMKNGLCIEASTETAMAGPPKADGSASFAKFGPMDDSRVKPDLVSFGDSVTLDVGTNNITQNSGTSFSTPAATGVAALVAEHFKNKVGSEPTAVMLKTLLCETATDLGQPGPDSVYGFGIVNALGAVSIINSRIDPSSSPFREGTVTNGQSQTFTINVASTLPVLKATLCWMDQPGAPGAAKALVNDLDMVLTDPNNVQFFPFSLNASAPMAAATNTGANNVDPIEQTIVQSPTPGTWTVKIIGTSIPMGQQDFAFCSNAVASAPLVAVIQASPTIGPAPLTVTFTGASSIGNIILYQWDFADGTTDIGPNVSHTYQFPLTTGQTKNFTATLTVTDTSGVTSTASVVITVTKPVLDDHGSAPGHPVFPSMASGKVNLLKSASNSLQINMLIPDFVRTPQQARDAVRDGVFEGKAFEVRAARVIDPILGTTTDYFPLYKFLLDRHATDLQKTEAFKLDLKKGLMTMKFKTRPDPVNPANPPIRDLAKFYGTTMGISPTSITGYNFTMRVQVETDNAIYQGDYQMSFIGKQGSGSVK